MKVKVGEPIWQLNSREEEKKAGQYQESLAQMRNEKTWCSESESETTTVKVKVGEPSWHLNRREEEKKIEQANIKRL